MGRKRKIDNPDERERAYRLWYEYLKEVEGYKEFCEWAIKVNLYGSLSDTKELQRMLRDFESEHASHPWAPFGNRFMHNFWDFGNVHARPFEDWWNRFLAYTPQQEASIKIVDVSKMVRSYIDQAFWRFKMKNKRDPGAQELRDTVDAILDYNHRLRRYDFYAVDPHMTKERAESEFRSAFTPKKRKFKVDLFPRFTGPIRDEVGKYLHAYRLSKKNILESGSPNLSKIADELGFRYDDSNRQQICHAYIEKAKNIIGFVDSGIFPGFYDDTSLRHRKTKSAE